MRAPSAAWLVTLCACLVVYLFLLRSQLSSLSWTLTALDARNPETPLPEASDALTCLSGVVTVEPGGRLANQIFELLSAWAVASGAGLQLRIPDEILAGVQGTYRNLGAVGSLEGELRHGRCRGKGLNASFVFQHTLPEDLERDIQPYVRWATRLKQPVVLRKWIVHLESIVPRLEQIRKDWRAWDVIEETVQAEFNNMREVMRLKYGNKTVVFVSVHVRRGDYEDLLMNKWNITTFADVPYFRRAVERMRHVLHETSPEVAVGFVVVSDDPDWCQEILLPVLQADLHVTRAGSVHESPGLPPAEVFESPFWTHPSPAYDLVLLTLCNHSILSYGTFGLWGAMKAGGHTIAYNLLNSRNPYAKVPNFVSDLRHWFPAWELLE